MKHNDAGFKIRVIWSPNSLLTTEYRCLCHLRPPSMYQTIPIQADEATGLLRLRITCGQYKVTFTASIDANYPEGGTELQIERHNFWPKIADAHLNQVAIVIAVAVTVADASPHQPINRPSDRPTNPTIRIT